MKGLGNAKRKVVVVMAKIWTMLCMEMLKAIRERASRFPEAV